MTLGSRLRELRAKMGLTQLEMANVVAKSLSAYKLWENDINEPNLKTLMFIADYFDVSIDYLVGRTAESYRKPVEPIELMLEAKIRGAYAETIHQIYKTCQSSHFLDSSALFEAYRILSIGIVDIFSDERWGGFINMVSVASQYMTFTTQDLTATAVDDIQERITFPLMKLFVRALPPAIKILDEEAEKRRIELVKARPSALKDFADPYVE